MISGPAPSRSICPKASATVGTYIPRRYTGQDAVLGSVRECTRRVRSRGLAAPVTQLARDTCSCFTAIRPPQTTDKLSVLVGTRTGLVGFGAKYNAYDERFENVMITYGGSDEALLARIKAAVAALEN
jgi:hypothetical protein